MSLNIPESSCCILDFAYKVGKVMGRKNLKEIISGFYCFITSSQ